MRNEEEVQRHQLERMTTTEIAARIEEHQEEMSTFIEQLVTRSMLQEYTEQQYDELLTLLQECLTFLEEVSPLPLQWIERRNELLASIKKKL